MARPQKKGLDYFPLDVSMDRTDSDVELLEAKYPASGFITLIKLYMKIYQEEGYFIRWGEKASLLLSKRVNADFNEVNDIINDLVRWEFFDSIIYEKYSILTSRRIQETYIDAVKKRKLVEVKSSIFLLEVVNSNIKLINDDIYSKKEVINPQSKEEKSKVNKSKVNKSKSDSKESVSDKLDFNLFWNLYDKKTGKDKCQKKWDKLNLETQNKILEYIPKYKIAEPDKKFRKNPETFFNNKSWEDEIISKNNNNNTSTLQFLEKKRGDDFGSKPMREADINYIKL